MSVQVNHRSLRELHAARRYREQLESAAAITFVALAEAGQLDDVTAAEQAELFAEWAVGVDYKAGSIRRHGDKLYRCIQGHKSQTDYAPDVAPSLWTVTSDPAEAWPAWSQPIGAHDAYTQGAQVTHKAQHWVSTYDGANVWEPGVHGWTLAGEEATP